MSSTEATSMAVEGSVAKATTRMPSQIKYIVGNEACERFSFYGMRTILVVFMTQYLMMSEAVSKTTYHLFVSACYLLPLLGAFIADRLWGKYNTILYISLFYCAGHAVLAISPTVGGLYLGLGLIAFGAGGIKPCVSAFVGDQFTKSNMHLVQRVYDVFYWSINFGAFFSSLLTPWLLRKYGHGVAFGVPGILMAIATVIFFLGRKQYVRVPAAGKTEGGYSAVLLYSLRNLGKRVEGQHLFDVALARYGSEKVEAAKAVNRIVRIFLTVSVFWALFDQSGSSWVLLSDKMTMDFMGMQLDASQIQAINPILVLAFIPIFGLWIYPSFERRGVKVTPLRKMSTGMYVAASSFVAVAVLQYFVDQGVKLNVMWMTVPYILLTAAEILISITGLEFAYTQAPKAAKSTIMSFWLLTVFLGNMFTAFISALNKFDGVASFLFFAALMLVVAFVFTFQAMRYKVTNYLEA